MSIFPDWSLIGLCAVVLVGGLWVWRRPSRSAAIRSSSARLLLAVALLAVISVRPTFGESITTTYASGYDVVLVVDRTTSMGAEDYRGKQARIEGVKADARKIIASVVGSRVAVVEFDNNARLALPFTTDAAAAVSLFDAMGWRESEYGNGSDIGIASELVETLLERSQEQYPNVGRYIVYFGDGEQTQSGTPAAFDNLRQYLSGGLVLGYGTASGGVMRKRTNAEELVTTSDGQTAISRIDEQNLRQIADQLGVVYEHRTADDPVVMETTGASEFPVLRKEPRGVEIYWVFAGVGAVLLVWQLLEEIRSLHRARRSLRWSD